MGMNIIKKYCSCRNDGSFLIPLYGSNKEEYKMNENDQIMEIVKNLRKEKNTIALVHANEDGSIDVRVEEKSDYSFLVCDESCEFPVLLEKLEQSGYSFDLDAFRGLIPARNLIKVDITNKTVSRPMIVGINHWYYLRKEESILLNDAINSFDQIVVKQNKELAQSLHQGVLKKNNRRSGNENK